MDVPTVDSKLPAPEGSFHHLENKLQTSGIQNLMWKMHKKIKVRFI